MTTDNLIRNSVNKQANGEMQPDSIKYATKKSPVVVATNSPKSVSQSKSLNNMSVKGKAAAGAQQTVKADKYEEEMFEETPLIQAIYTYICYAVLNIFGWIRDFMRNTGIEKRKGAKDPNPPVSWSCCNCDSVFLLLASLTWNNSLDPNKIKFLET